MENFTLTVENKGIVILCQNMCCEKGPYKGSLIENASFKNALNVMNYIFDCYTSWAIALHPVWVPCLLV